MGNTTTSAAMQPLLADAQEALALTPQQRARTIVRLDAGGGTLEEINACLSAGYQFHGNDFSTAGARHLCKSVQHWYDDPRQPGRQVGLVTTEPTDYVRPVVRIGERWSDTKGQEHNCVPISTLNAETILSVCGSAEAVGTDMETLLLAHAHFYDGRGGGIETGFGQD